MDNVAQELWEPEVDLPFLACRAAIELDNLIRDKGDDLNAVEQLIEIISNIGQVLGSDKKSGESIFAQLNPTTAVALNYAIAESKLSDKKTYLSELSKETGVIINIFKQLVDDPHKSKEENLDNVKKLKSFCIELSKHILASEYHLYETESWHPYRR
jgi:regulator of sigma D